MTKLEPCDMSLANMPTVFVPPPEYWLDEPDASLVLCALKVEKECSWYFLEGIPSNPTLPLP